MKQRFSVVHDGGTLEHVFNYLNALRNCMELVKLGGRLFIHAPANNWCGHGFYQFSPELFYRALSPQNGFEVERMIVHPVGPYGRWHEVVDPDQIGSRVEALTFYPLHVLIQAKRSSAIPIFASAPQQSAADPLLTRRLEAALRRLNPWLSDDNLRKAVRAIRQVQAAGLIEANEKSNVRIELRTQPEEKRPAPAKPASPQKNPKDA